MQSAVAPICIRDLRGNPLEFAARALHLLHVTFQLIIVDHLRFRADRSGSISGCGRVFFSYCFLRIVADSCSLLSRPCDSWA